MTSLITDLIVLALILRSQVESRPLEANYPRLLILAVIGVAETGVFLFGSHQLLSFVQGHHHHLTLIVPNGTAMMAAAVGSLILAVLTGALRTPSVRLWRQGGQVWRKGTALTVVLWLVSLGLHFGYDAVVARGKGDGGFGAATLILYIAASLTTQHITLTARAWRLRDGGTGTRFRASSAPGGPR